MKKLCSLLLAILVCFSVSTAVFAEGSSTYSSVLNQEFSFSIGDDLTTIKVDLESMTANEIKSLSTYLQKNGTAELIAEINELADSIRSAESKNSTLKNGQTNKIVEVTPKASSGRKTQLHSEEFYLGGLYYFYELTMGMDVTVSGNKMTWAGNATIGNLRHGANPVALLGGNPTASVTSSGRDAIYQCTYQIQTIAARRLDNGNIVVPLDVTLSKSCSFIYSIEDNW